MPDTLVILITLASISGPCPTLLGPYFRLCLGPSDGLSPSRRAEGLVPPRHVKKWRMLYKQTG